MSAIVVFFLQALLTSLRQDHMVGLRKTRRRRHGERPFGAMVHMRASSGKTRDTISAHGHAGIGMTTSLVEGFEGITMGRYGTEDSSLGVWKYVECWWDDLR